MTEITKPSPSHSSQLYTLKFSNGETESLTEKQLHKCIQLGKVGVGTRLSVYWKEPDCDYAATVTKLRETSREGWNVVYDFGEREWINLSKATFRILSQPRGDENDNDDDDDDDMEESTLQSEIVWSDDDKKEGSDDSIRSSNGLSPMDGLVLAPQNPKIMVGKKASSKTRSLLYGNGKASPPIDPGEVNMEFWGTPDNINNVDKGCRIALWWPGEQYAVVGHICMLRKGLFQLQHGNGSKDWVDLRKYRFKTLRLADGELVDSDRGEATFTLQEPEGSNDIDKLSVGSEIAIYWASTDTFHNCTIVDWKSDGRTNPFWIHYSQGDREWIRLDRVIWRLQSDGVAKNLVKEKQIDDFPMDVDIVQGGSVSGEELSNGKPDEERRSIDLTENPEDADISQANNSSSDESAIGDDTNDQQIQGESSEPNQKGSKSSHSDKSKNKNGKSTNLRTDDPSEIIVGSKVKIWQPSKKSWTTAMVTNILTESKAKPHQVEYEGGRKKWIDFGELTFRFLRGSKRQSDQGDASSYESVLPEQEDNELEILPGSKIRIWDPSENQHLKATVISYRRDGRDDPYLIELENGETQRTGFEFRSFRFLPGSIRCHSPFGQTKLYKFPTVEVGTRLHVWWENEAAWYVGTVTKIIPARERPHFVEYDDGDKEWLDLARKRFMLSDHGKGSKSQKWNHKAKGSSRGSNESCDSEIGLFSDDESDSDDEPNRGTVAKKARDSGVRSAEAAKRKKNASNKASDKTSDSDQKPSPAHASARQKRRKISTYVYQDMGSDEERQELLSKIRVGSRVSVWWDGNDAYFSGKVTQIRNRKKPFFIEYDDGDQEWVDLTHENFKIVER